MGGLVWFILALTVSEFENFKDWDHLIFGAVKNLNKFYLNVLIFDIFFYFQAFKHPQNQVKSSNLQQCDKYMSLYVQALTQLYLK